jgi:site-specific recombinase XerD
MIEDMQIRNLTLNTQRVYVEQVSRFARHFRKSPEHLGPAEIRAYLLYLTNDRRLAASSIIVTVSALRFFYTVTLKRPWAVEDDIPAGKQAKKLPVVLSQEEVACFPRFGLASRASRSSCPRFRQRIWGQVGWWMALPATPTMSIAPPSPPPAARTETS